MLKKMQGNSGDDLKSIFSTSEMEFAAFFMPIITLHDLCKMLTGVFGMYIFPPLDHSHSTYLPPTHHQNEPSVQHSVMKIAK